MGRVLYKTNFDGVRFRLLSAKVILSTKQRFIPIFIRDICWGFLPPLQNTGSYNRDIGQ